MTLIIKKVGKKQYYRDPLKGVYRNIENPKDTWLPTTKRNLGRMFDRIRVEEY